jgi:hypothetical protein
MYSNHTKSWVIVEILFTLLATQIFVANIILLMMYKISDAVPVTAITSTLSRSTCIRFVAVAR